jgi:hypothetical protein
MGQFPITSLFARDLSESFSEGGAAQPHMDINDYLID